MAKKKKEEKKSEDKVELARERFKKLCDAEFSIRANALENLRFVYNVENGQWPSSIRDERITDGRPCLTSNKLRKYVAQVANRERDQRMTGKVRPIDDLADPQTAKIIEGIIRQIEYESNANAIYTSAGEAAIAGGFGYWRIITKESENSFEQDILIKKIDNQFSVYLDPKGNYGFIREGMTKKEFEDSYPDKLPEDFDLTSIGEEWELWYEEDKIFVADYYYKEKYDKTIAQIVNIMNPMDVKIIELKEGINAETLMMNGWTIVKQKTVQATRIKWERISGHDILEEGYWVGDDIPIIEVVGDAFNIAGKNYKNGLVNDAKDPQKMYNFWLPLALDTKLPTPNGWTTMGGIEIGDELFDDKGRICSVLGTSPIYKDRTCYRITFDDGSYIDADKDHLWQVEERGRRRSDTFQWTIKKCTTEQLEPDKHFMYTTNPLIIEYKELPIHPYILGVWLGDGDSHSAYITAGKREINEIRANIEQAGYKVNPISWDKRTGAGRFSICGLITQLKELSLIKNKHVPKQYLRSSYEQRLSLLQGLMDTDGSISKTLLCSFTTTLNSLKEDFSELLRTIGIKAVYCARQPRKETIVQHKDKSYIIKPKLISFQFSFSSPENEQIFRLSRKANIQKTKQSFHPRRTKRHSIVSVKQIDTVPVKCIKVTSPSRLFLAGEAMIPTHNTHMTETVALAPKSPYIVSPQEIKGFEAQWNDANKKNYPYLLVNPQGKDKPRREPPPQIPTGASQMLQLAAGDVQDTIGMYQASFGERSNERTGVAIRERAGRSEFGTYHFSDNFGRAVLASTKQLINIIPRIYDTERIVRILGEDGKDSLVKINETIINLITGEKIILNDLTIGKYDVVANIGMYSTRRQEAVEMMSTTMQAAPNIAPLMVDLLFKASDWPYADEIEKRIQANLPALLGQGQGQKPPPTGGQAPPFL